MGIFPGPPNTSELTNELPVGWAVRCDVGVGFCRVTASGELDLLAVPGLESRLLEARRHGEDRVVIGLAEVTFIDCAALRTLIAAQEQARSAGGWLKLEGPSPVVRRLLDVTGTAELFTWSTPWTEQRSRDTDAATPGVRVPDRHEAAL